jgi:hypothetical protein
MNVKIRDNVYISYYILYIAYNILYIKYIIYCVLYVVYYIIYHMVIYVLYNTILTNTWNQFRSFKPITTYSTQNIYFSIITACL